MLTSVCLAVIAVAMAFRLVRPLRRLRRARASVAATRLGATLPPAWRPPAVRPATAPDPVHTAPPTDWSRYDRPACVRWRSPTGLLTRRRVSHAESNPDHRTPGA